ncbi:Phenylacetaldehyde reductase [Linum perenne]
MSEEGKGKVVCVTGASGYIASWLVKLLLQGGYTVKATVRDPNNPKKTQHLLALDGAKERLNLFKADLLDEGSFDNVVEGCEGVFHTASPFYLNATDPQARSLVPSISILVLKHNKHELFHSVTICSLQAELVDPAVKGTLNVLRSCAKVPSIKRVVITSSMAAVAFNGRTLAPDVVVDETWFSDADFCRKSKLWYMLAKTLAEELAWKFSKENGIDIVTLNPGLVIGPLLQPTLNTSAESILNLVKGAEKYPNTTYRWVDVRDVAYAHIYALENPSASGRYCLVGAVVHASEAVNILHDLFPDLIIPQECADDKPPMPKYQVSKERVESLLGVKYTPLETSLKDTVESLKEKKLV